MNESIRQALNEIADRIDPAALRATILCVLVRREILGWLEKNSRSVGELAVASGLDPVGLKAFLNGDVRQITISEIAMLECALEQTLIDVNEQHCYSIPLGIEIVTPEIG